MKSPFLLLFALSLSAFAGMPPAKGCGPEMEGWAVKAHTVAVPEILAPQEGMATIVYLNHAVLGYYNQVRVGTDGQWKIATARHSYASFAVAPGEHAICAAVRPSGAHELAIWIPIKVEAGKTYFIAENYPSPIGRPQLEILNEANGKGQIASLKLAVSHPKN